MRYWTYAEIKTKVQKDLGLEEEDFVSADELLGYCNEAIDEAEGEIHTLYEDYFLDSVSLPLVNGQVEYTLPGSIFASKIRSIIYNDGSEVYPIRRFKEHKKFEKIACAMNSTHTDYQYVLKNTILPIPPEPAAWAPCSIAPWVSGQAYLPGDIVTESGSIYECLDAYSEVFFSPTVPYIFEETFTDAGVLVFSDVTKAEVFGGVLQQIDQRPASGRLLHTFDQNNADWNKDGPTTLTLVNGVTVAGSSLVMPAQGALPAYAIFNAGAVRLDMLGTIRMVFTPNYATVTNSYYFLSLYNGVNNNDRLDIYQSVGDRRIRVQGYNSAGGLIASGLFFGAPAAWTPGTPYSFEFKFNFTTGVHEMYINGALLGTINSAYTRSDAITSLYVGSRTVLAPSTDAITIDTLEIFNTNAAPAATLQSLIYAASYVTLPEWTTPDLLSLLTITGTATGAKFSIRLLGTADFLWHDGTAWIVSNRTYAESNTLAEISANDDTLDVETAGGMQLEVYFSDGDTKQSVDIIQYLVEKYAWEFQGIKDPEYVVGDLCRYLNTNYECLVPNCDIVFTPAKWLALAPYLTVPEPAVQLMLIPAPKEDSASNVTIWYIRNANHMAVDEDICDIPEFTSFVIQYMKVRCYEKEQNENLQFATTALEALRAKMINTLTVKEPDDNNEIEMDLSDYEDSTGVNNGNNGFY